MNIELEITLRCNAHCLGCSRHSPYLNNTDTDMSMDQINKFIQEVKNHGNIHLVSIMGGEPTIHPNFEEIVHKIYNELVPHSLQILQIASNGSHKMPESFQKLKLGIITSIPSTKDHRCQFLAPYDTGQSTKDYCIIPDTCGISVNIYGCNPCGAGGAIARLLGLNQYIKTSIPKSLVEFGDLSGLCQYCQVKANTWMWIKDFGDIKSRSFQEAFAHPETGNYKTRY